MNSKINVFQYSCLQEVFKAILGHKKQTNPSYSLRAWSRTLEYKHPSFLSQCLKGERTIHRALLSKVIETEKFSNAEVVYLTALFYKNVADEQDKNLFDNVLAYIGIKKDQLKYNEGILNIDGAQ